MNFIVERFLALISSLSEDELGYVRNAIDAEFLSRDPVFDECIFPPMWNLMEHEIFRLHDNSIAEISRI